MYRLNGLVEWGILSFIRVQYTWFHINLFNEWSNIYPFSFVVGQLDIFLFTLFQLVWMTTTHWFPYEFINAHVYYYIVDERIIKSMNERKGRINGMNVKWAAKLPINSCSNVSILAYSSMDQYYMSIYIISLVFMCFMTSADVDWKHMGNNVFRKSPNWWQIELFSLSCTMPKEKKRRTMFQLTTELEWIKEVPWLIYFLITKWYDTCSSALAGRGHAKEYKIVARHHCFLQPYN